MITLIFILCGIVIGFLSGFFGIGGGMIAVPLLLFSLEYLGVNQESLSQTAIFTSAAIIVCNSFISACTHWRYQKYPLRLFVILAGGLILGSLLGAMSLIQLDSKIVQILLGLFFLFSAYALGIKRNYLGYLKPVLIKLPLGLVAVFVGGFSVIFGIGGATFNVPLLIGHGLDIKKAISISTACAVLVGLTSVISSMVYSATTGLPILYYIYVPALIPIVLSASLFVVCGARLTQRTRSDYIKRLFSLVLLLIAVYVLLKAMVDI